MPVFGLKSIAILNTCHVDLQTVLHKAIEIVDFAVIEGHRGQADQDAAFARGSSDKKWPDGKHNTIPSLAVDIVPWPCVWSDNKRFIRLLSFIQGLGYGMGIPLRIGGDWNNDFVFNEKLVDWPHIELIHPSSPSPSLQS